MENKLNKTCVYYHGLGGESCEWLKTYLKKFGYYVITETIDFYNEWFKDSGKSLMENQLRKYKNVDLFIGLSFGGYVAYLMSKGTGSDVLLINPAVNRKRTKTGIGEFNIPKDVYNKNSNIEVFFGERDVVVPYQYTIEYFNITGEKFIGWKIPYMQHAIDGYDFDVIINHSTLIKNQSKSELNLI